MDDEWQVIRDDQSLESAPASIPRQEISTVKFQYPNKFQDSKFKPPLLALAHPLRFSI
jgi:hypothetical protein